MKRYLIFWKDMIKEGITGGKIYWSWLSFLLILTVTGFVAYYEQLKYGLVVTNLSNQVSWGAYIANFTFLVGVAAAAVLLVVPAYLLHNKAVKNCNSK